MSYANPPNMKVVSDTIKLQTEGEGDMIDMTSQLSNIVKESKIKNGTVTIFVLGSTAAVTTIEYESGLIHDFPVMLSRIVPKGIEYEHDNTWHDGNGHSHVRSSLIGPSITIPIIHGKLTLGTWQQVVLLEMDTRSRNRTVILQIMGQ
ncbi:MAG: secondary thiamine-phosphate synthase enzyme YjbQ [Nitrososphaeraceae archaeon]|nr:secondary thiamine-phosphate synthase enzyme YjbQ [Nitrososphaeraceae archaeon]